ncbi:MAG: response regulator [bacterium]
MTTSNQPTKILIVDDDSAIREIIRLSLNLSGYAIVEAQNGLEALKMTITEEPDLIILDIMMPGMSGMEVCKKLKESTITSHIPILMLTARYELEDKVKGLEVGADGYLVKPFDPMELEARVKALIRQVRRDLYANPLTKLPGNISIEKEIQDVIDSKKKFAVCYLDIDDFKAYNDFYGYASGDKIIKLTASIISDTIKEYGNKEDFVGHIGGDDFILIATPYKVEKICRKIIDLFDNLVPTYYKEGDRHKGYIIGKDRKGKTTKFPLMSLSIVIVTNEESEFKHHLKVSEIAAELKKHVKLLPGSNYMFNRRKNIKNPSLES